jgi:hypothetical protein
MIKAKGNNSRIKARGLVKVANTLTCLCGMMRRQAWYTCRVRERSYNMTQCRQIKAKERTQDKKNRQGGNRTHLGHKFFKDGVVDPQVDVPAPETLFGGRGHHGHGALVDFTRCINCQI